MKFKINYNLNTFKIQSRIQFAILLYVVPLLSFIESERKRTIRDNIDIFERRNEAIFSGITKKLNEKIEKLKQIKLETKPVNEHLENLTRFIDQKKNENRLEINVAYKLLEFTAKDYFDSLIDAKINDLEKVERALSLNPLDGQSKINNVGFFNTKNIPIEEENYNEFEKVLCEKQIYEQFHVMMNQYTRNNSSCIEVDLMLNDEVKNQLLDVIENQKKMFNDLKEAVKTDFVGESENDGETDGETDEIINPEIVELN